MYLVINKCVTAVILSNFSRHYLRNRSTSDIGVLGYIGVLWHKEHSPEVWHIPPGTLCIRKIIWQYSPDVGRHAICWDVCTFYQFQVLAKRLFSSPRRPYRLLDHSPLYAIGTRVSFPGGKAVGARSWTLTSAEVNKWSCTSVPPCVFIACVWTTS